VVTGYDIIGDVHGCADKLRVLLETLGYRERDGAYRHSGDRQAVFVGDLIDRGLYQLDSVAIPRAMVEYGTAQMVIGNHEFNAVAFATRNAADNGYCRAHNDKNHLQHKDFLAAAPFRSATHHSILSWFMSLPLWLDLGDVRVVHACWHDESMDCLSELVSANGGLTDELVREATTKEAAAYDAVEVVLKGPEVEMAGCSYLDKEGHKRTAGRAKWWEPDAATLAEVVLLGNGWPLRDENGQPVDALPDIPIAELGEVVPSYGSSEKPVLFGHYWFNGEPHLQAPNAACVDYSAVKGGSLVAYRFDGEPTLGRASFVAV
jgi:hypothetical protein